MTRSKVYVDDYLAAAHPERVKPFWLYRLRNDRLFVAEHPGCTLNYRGPMTKFRLSHVRMRQGRWA